MAQLRLQAERAIKELGIELDTAEYISFLREVSEWATEQADMLEFNLELREDQD
jgi:hypothetical protein